MLSWGAPQSFRRPVPPGGVPGVSDVCRAALGPEYLHVARRLFERDGLRVAIDHSVADNVLVEVRCCRDEDEGRSDAADEQDDGAGQIETARKHRLVQVNCG